MQRRGAWSFALRHAACPAEDALGHCAAGLRNPVADMSGCARIDRAPAMLAGLGQAIVLRNVRRDFHLAERRDMAARVIGLVLADLMRREFFVFFLSIASEAHRSAEPFALLAIPATARPLRFSITT